LPRSIQKVMVAQNSRQILGLVLTVLGLAPIIAVLLNAWTSGISFLDLSALYGFLWTDRFYIGFGTGFELIYLVILGSIIIISGLALLARRTRQIQEVTVVTDDLTVTLECTVCKNRWKEHFSEAQLQAMGFPQNRRISRRRCEACRKFTRPKIIGV
jgi:hypothetical protein